MQDHTLQVGEELEIQGHVRLTILAVDQDEVLLGISAEPNSVRGPVARQRRIRQMAVPASCDAPVTLRKETTND
jgi:sRNA-binding carbon storage regulator CsrA